MATNKTLKVTANTGSVPGDLAQFTDALKNLQDVVDGAALANVRFNKTGKQAVLTLQDIGSAGETITATFNKNKKSLSLVNLEITAHTSKLKEAKAAYDLVQKSAALGIGNTRATSTFAALGINTSTSSDKLKQQAADAQRTLAKALSDPTLTQGSFAQVLGDLQSGVVKAEAGIRGKLQDAFKEVLKVQQDIVKEADKLKEKNDKAATALSAKNQKIQDTFLNKQAGIATVDDLKKLFPTPANANLKQLADYELKLKNIADLVGSGKITQKEVTDIGSAVAAGHTLDNLTTSGVKVQKTLVDLKGSFAELGKDGKKNIDVVGAAFDRLEGIIVRAGIRQAFFGVVEAVKQGVKDSVEIDLAIGKLQVSTQGTGLAFNHLGAEIRALSDNTGIKQIDLAAAGVELFTQRATTGAEAFNLLRTSIQLSQSTLSTTEESATALSRTLNSFSLANAEATQTSAILFRTTQLTSSKIADVGEAFVHTSQSAKALGIDLQTVAGFIATLGSNGFTASESATLLDGILAKLLKPTKELQETFRQLGVDSGEQLLSRFGGLTGALEALVNVAGGDNSKLEELVGGLKQLKAFLAATGDGLQDLKRNTDDVSNSIGNFGKAATDSTANAGAKIKKEFETIANFFSKDIGSNLTAAFQTISFGTVSLSTAVKYLTGVVGLGAVAWAIYRVGTISANAAALVLQPTLLADTIAARNLTVQMQASATTALFWKSALLAVGGAASILAVTLLALGSGASFFSGGQFDFTANTEGIQRTIDLTFAAREQLAHADEQARANSKHLDDKEFDDRVSGLQKYISAVTILGHDAINALQTQERQISEVLKLNSELVLEDLKVALSDLKRDASQAKSEIDASKKAQAGFGGKLDDKFFDHALKFEQNPFNSLTLLTDRRKRILSEITATENSADKASIDATRKKFDTLEKLNEDRSNKIAEITRKRAQVAIEQGDKSFERIDQITGKPVNEVPINVTEFQKEELRIVSSRAAYEEKIRNLLLDQEKITRRKIIAETITQKGIENSIKKLTEFSIFDSKGNIEKRFRGKTPEEGINKALTEFDRQQTKVKELIGPDAFKQLDEFAALGEKRKTISAQAELAIKLDAQKNNAEELANFRKKTEEEITILEKKKKASFDASDKAIQEIQDQIEILRATSQKTLAIATPLFTAGKKIGFGEGRGPIGLAIAEQQKFKDASLAADAALQAANSDRNDPEKLKKLNEAIVNLASAYDRLGAAASKIGVGDRLNEVKPASGAQSAITALEKFQELQKSAAILGSGINDRKELDSKIDSRSDSLKTAKDRLQEAETELSRYAELSEQANKRVGESFGSTNRDIGQLIGSIEALSKSISELSKIKINVPRIPGIQNVGDFTQGGEAKNYATGGPVFSPSGTDTIPAMLSPGEYVWDANTTRQFYPLISAIHARSASPVYKASGGSVTNIGDINLNISGGGTAEQTTRDIVYRIRRELRRGAISNG